MNQIIVKLIPYEFKRVEWNLRLIRLSLDKMFEST